MKKGKAEVRNDSEWDIRRSQFANASGFSLTFNLQFNSIQFNSLINTDQVSPLFKTFDTIRVRVATPYASVRSDSSFHKRLKVQLIGH
jgi:hypothetical protein